MADKKSLSMQEEESLMEEIKNYPCLYDKSKTWYREREVSRNTWTKAAEKLDVMQNSIYTYVTFD